MSSASASSWPRTSASSTSSWPSTSWRSTSLLPCALLAWDHLLSGLVMTSASRRHALQAPALPLAHSSPHPIAFVASEGVVEALDANGALGADPFGLARGSALLGKEDLRVEVSASRSVLPWNEMVHASSPPKLHCCNSEPLRTRNASPGPNFFRPGSSLHLHPRSWSYHRPHASHGGHFFPSQPG